MAETTDTTPTVPIECTGSAQIAVFHSGDTYGHSAVVEWSGDEVTITRKSSGCRDKTTTTEYDAVTESALLHLTVPRVRPPDDFRLMILADDCSGVWPGFLHLSVIGGKAEVVDRSGKSWPARIPSWFLGALRDLVLVEWEED